MRPFRIALISVAFLAAAWADAASAQDITLQLAQADTNIGALFTKYFNFAFMLAGILAFGVIVYGGFQYMISAGNPSGQSDARDRVLQAIIGLLLLVGAGLILRTIDPKLASLELGKLTELRAPKPPAGGSGPPAAQCAGGEAVVAAQNKVPYPAKKDLDLDKLINCILGKVQGNSAVKTVGSIATVDVSNPWCNFTRGLSVCTPGKGCSHSAYSCHYGGRTGTTGSLAVDFGMGAGDTDPKEAQIVTDAAKACDPGAKVLSILNRPTDHRDHIHVSLGKCDGT
jgi:hypothetical protein